MIPADRRARGPLRFLVAPPTRRAQWALRALALGLAVGLPVGVSETLRNEAGTLVGISSPRVAIYVGTQGAYRKALVFVAGEEGQGAVIKWALLPGADGAVEREYEALRYLSGVVEVKGTMPTPLTSGRWHGRLYFVMCPLLGRLGGRRLLGLHWDWAARLFSLERKILRWEESPFRQCLSRILKAPLPHVETLRTALGTLDHMLGGRFLSFGWAHRDFAPWNLRVRRGALVVLDWEMAVPAAPPGYDLLHFLAIQAALAGKAVRWPLAVFQKWLEGVAPDWVPLLPGVVLSYLLDQASIYAEARHRAPHVGEERVLAWLLRKLEEAADHVA